MKYCLFVPLITVLVTGGLGQDVYIKLGNNMIPEHSLVNHYDIGDSSETGLRCVTERLDCCSGDNGTRAEWFDPRNTTAGGGAFLRTRNGVGSDEGYVILFRRKQMHSDHALQGIYHCNIPAPSPSNAIRTLYIGIYKDYGVPTITNITYDRLSSEIFTLTCISTGGPATNVTWTLNGSVITYDANHVLTQTVVNAITAEYNNTLTVTGREAGNYQCTVSNAKGSDTSRLLVLNFTEQPISSTEVIVVSSYNHQPASSSKLMSSSITPLPLSTPPTDMSMACNSAIVGSAMAAVLLVVTVILSIVIVLLVLRLRHLSSSLQKNPGVEMLSGSGAIPVEECVAYEPQRGKGGGGGGGGRGGGGGGAFYSEPAYEMGVISEQPVAGKKVLSSTTEETVYEQLD